MAESLVSAVLGQLFSIIRQPAAHELNLITGVENEVKTLTSNLQAIKAVLEDAEKKQVNDSAAKLWLDSLKDAAYDIDDVLDEWNTAILKRQIQQEFGAGVQGHAPLPKKVWLPFTLSSSCFCFRQVILRHETAVKIEALNKRLADIANERRRYNFTVGSATHHEQRMLTTSVFDESEVFAREEDEKKIKEMLLCDESSSSQETSAALPVISIVGMGGLGKTTLARLAFNDTQVKSHFEKRIWVCVSDPFDEGRFAFEILESLLGANPNLVGRDNILREISEHVSKKKILLVLDDVWTEDSSNWEQLKGSLKNSSPGSRILVTTRNEMVALIGMGTRKKDVFWLGKLSEDKCWSLFCHLAFVERTTEERNNLENIGRKFVERCQGLPLAVKIIGGLLRFKDGKQWQNMLDSKMWEIEDFASGVFPPLLLSYYDLPPVLKQCFTYCAVFPKDYEIEKEKLIKLWMAQGFLEEARSSGMEILGEDYFNKLAMRSFFQDFREDKYDDNVISCKMHDIVHDFAQYLTKNECLLIEVFDNKKTMPDPSLETIRHSMLVVETTRSFPVPMSNWRKLRTLLVDPDKPDGDLLKSIDQLTCLRTLDLSRSIYNSSNFIQIPDEIGKLMHLRYLNLSGYTNLEMLPPALYDLCNLQTLDITRCRFLTELPPGIGKLINLEHLENEMTNLDFIPREMERLTCLRTLRQFHSGSMVTFKSKSCRLEVEGLGKLTHLQGSLTLNLGIREAAPLSGLTNLQKLTLQFEYCHKIQDQAFILQALQPPPNLQTLLIYNIRVPTLVSDWMMSLMKLRKVELKSCQNLESLPPMGKLPCLEKLYIYNLRKLQKVGEEFLGIDKQDLGQSSCPSSSSIAFPKLKILVFAELREWVDWEYGSFLSKSGGCSITIMPLLFFLGISNCPKLKALPQHLLQNTPILQELSISSCPILKEHYKKGGKDRHLISHIPNLSIY